MVYFMDTNLKSKYFTNEILDLHFQDNKKFSAVA